MFCWNLTVRSVIEHSIVSLRSSSKGAASMSTCSIGYLCAIIALDRRPPSWIGTWTFCRIIGKRRTLCLSWWVCGAYYSMTEGWVIGKSLGR